MAKYGKPISPKNIQLNWIQKLVVYSTTTTTVLLYSLFVIVDNIIYSVDIPPIMNVFFGIVLFILTLEFLDRYEWATLFLKGTINWYLFFVAVGVTWYLIEEIYYIDLWYFFKKILSESLQILVPAMIFCVLLYILESILLLYIIIYSSIIWLLLYFYTYVLGGSSDDEGAHLLLTILFFLFWVDWACV